MPKIPSLLRTSPGRRSFIATVLSTISIGSVATCVAGPAAADKPKARKARQSECATDRAPMRDVTGKVAFITGGSSGIGLGIAQAFLESGMKVALGYRSKDHLDEALALLKQYEDAVHPIQVDVTDRAQMESAAAETVKTFGRVHVLVNNAGVQQKTQSLSEMPYEEWDKVMAVNVGGVFNGIHSFLPLLKQHNEGGQVVTTASILGLSTLGKYAGAYCASKFAAVAMMETLRAELAGSNIGVSVLCPGPVKSNLDPWLKDYSPALDPLEVGRTVLQAVRRNDLYILTHPELNPMILARAGFITKPEIGVSPPTKDREALAREWLKITIYEQPCG